jgi:quaternary ammonium compound-resistance protein SugE
MPWLYILIAGMFEIMWAIGLKYTDGLSKPIPTALTIVAMLISFGVLAMGVKHLPVGTAYAVWTGIGAAGTAIFGVILFGEPVNAMRIACLMLVITGIIGLKLTAIADVAPQ